MKVREYLEAIGKTDGDSITFIIAKAVKDEHSPYYHEEYRTTPMRSAWEWLGEDSKIGDYLVLNGNQPPICHITAMHFANHYNWGHLQCLLVTTEKDLRTRYSESQAQDMIDMYDREIRKSLGKQK